ncbi:MAG: sigma-70 family RNA polymerase sigma factor [Planctomycetota bacterium]
MIQPTGQPDPSSEVQRLFVQNATVIRGFIVTLMPNRDQVEDVFHEVFLVVVDKADDFEPGTDFLAWVFTISKFKVLQALKKTRTRRTSVLAPDVLESLIESAPTDSFSEDTINALNVCVQTLAPAARRVVKLRYEDALKPAAIAERLGIAASTIYVTLSRARSTLRQCVNAKLAEARQRGGRA